MQNRESIVRNFNIKYRKKSKEIYRGDCDKSTNGEMCNLDLMNIQKWNGKDRMKAKGATDKSGNEKNNQLNIFNKVSDNSSQNQHQQLTKVNLDNKGEFGDGKCIPCHV